LVAVHLAARALRSGDCELALAGGVNVILQPYIHLAYSQSRMMAPDGRCKFGDASGDGYVRSEGAGLVVLKRVEQALADSDRIYAVVRGSAVNNDGRSSGVLGRPSPTGHEELLRSAYADADIAPREVGYVEAHGTGTRAGDPVEIGALGKVLGEGRSDEAQCWVGSVKTNFGHTESAAGIAGFIKATLALHHRAVPPSLHFNEPNPQVPWAEYRARCRAGPMTGPRALRASTLSASPARTRTRCSRPGRHRRLSCSAHARDHKRALPCSCSRRAAPRRCAIWPHGIWSACNAWPTCRARHWTICAGQRPHAAPR
jgi:acyl transferase domain-containing protein